MDKLNFIALCAIGKAGLAEIDDYVERWHKGLAGQRVPLQEYLGMSQEEYARWILNPDTLEQIIASRAGQAKRLSGT